MKKEKLKIVYYFCLVIYILTLGYAFYKNINNHYLGMTFVAGITPFIVPVIVKLLKIKVPYEVYILNLVFVYFASLIGSCLGGYSTPYFDKVVHCASGVVISEVVYIVYKYYLRNDYRRSLMFLFINAGNAMIALFWEFYEYALLVFFNHDAIRHYASGVHDSMTDMLVAMVGGFVLSLYLIKFDQSSKSHFFVSLERNIQKMNRFKKSC